tara:strand:- start:26861 stop:27148 length:288 start_codon:yes stop_codon:yes gene_type:complete
MKKINRKGLAKRGGGSGSPKASGGHKTTLVPFAATRGKSAAAKAPSVRKYRKAKDAPAKGRTDYRSSKNLKGSASGKKGPYLKSTKRPSIPPRRP